MIMMMMLSVAKGLKVLNHCKHHRLTAAHLLIVWGSSAGLMDK